MISPRSVNDSRGGPGVADVGEKQLAERENADQNGDEVETAQECVDAEVEPADADRLILADRPAPEGRSAPAIKPLTMLSPARLAVTVKREHHQHEEIPGLELEPDARELGREQNEHDGADSVPPQKDDQTPRPSA